MADRRSSKGKKRRSPATDRRNRTLQTGTGRPVLQPVPPPAEITTRWRIESWLESKVAWLDAFGVGPWLRRGLFVILALLPFVQATIEGGGGFWFVGLATLCLLGFTPLERYKNAADRRQAVAERDTLQSELHQLRRRVAHTNAAFAGTIESLTEGLRTGNRRIDENECRQICMHLLQRVVQFAELALDCKPGTLRATLVVPLGSREPECLRVWAYNDTHGERHWSRLELHWPGAAEAFKTGQVRILDNVEKLTVHRLDGTAVSWSGYPYRSVASIPVAGGSAGGPLAVVNLDANEADFFEMFVLTTQVLPLILPVVQAVGLAIQSRGEGEAYVFNK